MFQIGHLHPRNGYLAVEHPIVIFSVAGHKQLVFLASRAVKELFSVAKYKEPVFLASHDVKKFLAVSVALAILQVQECLGRERSRNDEHFHGRQDVSLPCERYFR